MISFAFSTIKQVRTTGSLRIVASLFDRENKNRNKAAFQTFLYGLLFKSVRPDFSGKIQAGLFNVRELFKQDFDFLLRQKNGSRSAERVEDITPYSG